MKSLVISKNEPRAQIVPVQPALPSIIMAVEQQQEPPSTEVPKKKLPKSIIGTTVEDLREAQEAGEESNGNAELLTTAPFDARFPNTNQTRTCWQYYVDFHKCSRAKADEGGAEHPGCRKLQRLARIMCPSSWIEKWNDELDEGINPSDMNPPTKNV